MSIFRSGSVSNLTRGGQTTIHFIRMIWQVCIEFARITLILFAVLVAAGYWVQTDPQTRAFTINYGMAWVKVEGLRIKDATVDITTEDGQVYQAAADKLMQHPAFVDSVNASYSAIVWALVSGGFLTILGMGLGVKFLYATGRGFAEEEFVRGGRLVDAAELKRVVKRTAKTGGLTINGIPVPVESEPAHFLIAGSSGTGKSVTLKEMFQHIRRQHQRAIIYDPSGDMVSHFYRPEVDVILNPFDTRSGGWNIWAECVYDYDFDHAASVFVPDPNGPNADPFWSKGGRIVLSAMAQKLASQGRVSNQVLVDTIMKLSIEEIVSFLARTEGAAVIDEGAEKMAMSIRAHLATCLKPLKYMPDTANIFSLRQWVKNEEDDGWVFLTAKDDKKSIAIPLITTWMDIAASAILSLKPDRERRIWLAVDELPSLNKIPALANFLAQSRKYGGCAILGVQSYSQLKSIYGEDVADTLTGLCSTRAIFRFNDPASAEWASKNIGQMEQLEPSEGISYGVNDMRDGVSLSRTRQVRPMVMPTEITELPDLHGYLRFGRGLPVGRFKAHYVKHPIIAEAYADREIPLPTLVIDQATANPRSLEQSEADGLPSFDVTTGTLYQEAWQK